MAAANAPITMKEALTKVSKGKKQMTIDLTPFRD